MDHRELQARVERRDDALLIDADRKAELADRAHELAEDLAREIVRDPQRFIALLANLNAGTGLHEIDVYDRLRGRHYTVEEALLMHVADALSPLPSGRSAAWIGDGIIKWLAETPDVQDEATRRAYADMADEQADRTDWERY